jgi:hypothetical protein
MAKRFSGGKKKSKKKLQKHAFRRGKTRFDTNLHQHRQTTIVKTIQGDETFVGCSATFLEKQSNNRSLWLVESEGETLPVIYDKTYKSLVTVFPMSYVKERGLLEDDEED